MSGEFNAHKAARALRKAAQLEIHGFLDERPLAHEFNKIPSEQLNAVAAALENENAVLGFSTSPQALVRRDCLGNVINIEFCPGILDSQDYGRRVMVGHM
jgi:hypothetical protein